MLEHDRSRQFGRFAILEQIGSGGMGVVYRARDSQSPDGPALALKILSRTSAIGSAADIVLWRRELEALSGIGHPNIVRLVDFGEVEGELYIVTELVEGVTLGEFCRGRRLPLSLALGIALQIVAALRYAHSMDLLHLDLKPQNILVAGEPLVARVLDFGLARFLHEINLSDDTRVAGTPLYMAPEQLRTESGNRGPQTDLYAVGEILYQMLCAKPAFESCDVAELIKAKSTGSYQSMTQLAPGAPTAVRRMVDKLLDPYLSRRYRSAEGLLHDLEMSYRLAEQGNAEFDLDLGSRDHPVSAPMHVRFVGREPELEKLLGRFAQCSNGVGRVSYVAGPAGIGKTRLAGELGQRVVEQGGAFLLGKATRNTRNIPYYPLLTAVGEYLESHSESDAPSEQARSVPRERLFDLLNLLAGRAGAEEIQLDIEHGRERFQHRVMNALVGAATVSRPLVLAIDDLQWADHATIHIIERLATRISDAPVLVLGMYRDDELDPQHYLCRSVGRVGEAVDVVHLEALGLDENRVLVTEMLDPLPGQMDELCSFLALHAGGNPFNTVALVANLVEQKVLVRQPAGWSVDAAGLSAFVTQGGQTRVVASLLDALHLDGVEILSWAAVLGHNFDPEFLGKFVQGGVVAIHDRLQAAASRGVVRRIGGGQYQFSHDRFRDHLYETLPTSERRMRHERVARALEETLDSGDHRGVLNVAEHYSRGTSIDKALQYALEAGHIASRSHAYDSAMRYAKAALLMLGASSAQSPDAGLMALKARRILGDTYAGIGDYDAALTQYADALKHVGNSEERAVIGGRRATVHFMKGELVVAAHHMEDALRLLGVRLPGNRFQTVVSVLGSAFRLSLPRRSAAADAFEQGPSELERVKLAMLNKLVFIYFFFNMERTLAAQLISLRLAERTAPCPETVEIKGMHAPIMCGVPMARRAMRYANESCAMASRLSLPGTSMQASFYAGICYYFLGRWRQATTHLRDAISLFQETGDIFTLELAHENLGFTYYYQGDFETALAHFQKGLELSQEVGDNRGTVVNRMFMSRVDVAYGRLESAQRQISVAEVVAESVRDNSLNAGVAYTRGMISLASGNVEKALAELRASADIVNEHKLLQEYVAPVFSLLSETILQLGKDGERPPGSLRRLAGLVRSAESFGRRFPAHKGPALRARALLELYRGNRRKAERAFSESATALGNLSMTHELARTYEFWAQFFDGGDPGRFGALWMAAGHYRNVGAITATERVMGRLRGTDEAKPIDETGGRPVVDVTARDRQLRSLIDVGRVLSSTLDISELLEQTMDSVMEVAGAERGLLLMRESTDTEFAVRVARSGGPATSGSRDFSSRSVVELVLRTKEPVLISDALTDPRLFSSKSVYAHQLRSVLCFPLVARAVVTGVIYLENNQASSLFGAHHLDLIRIFAAQASIALENGLAYQAIEQLNVDLEAQVEERTAQLNDASGSLRERNEELRTTIEELKTTRDRMIKQAKLASLGRMAAGATHEINNPLNFVQAGAYAVRKKLGVLENRLGGNADDPELKQNLERVRELSDIIINGCDRIKGIVEGLWSLAGQRDREQQLFDIENGLLATARFLQVSNAPNIELKTRCEPVARVLGSPAELNQLSMNLLLNALEAVGEGGCVTISTFMRDGSVCFSVADDGPGVPREMRERIFEPFHTTKDLSKGRGLGLAICASIAEGHGGSIIVEDVEGGGTNFIVTLPAGAGISTNDESSPLTGGKQ